MVSRGTVAVLSAKSIQVMSTKRQILIFEMQTTVNGSIELIDRLKAKCEICEVMVWTRSSR